ncbi:hypothetical protein ACQ4PT_060167 [Festuca glaucescens]
MDCWMAYLLKEVTFFLTGHFYTGSHRHELGKVLSVGSQGPCKIPANCTQAHAVVRIKATGKTAPTLYLGFAPPPPAATIQMPTELKRVAADDGSSTSRIDRRRIDHPDKPMYLVVEHKAAKKKAGKPSFSVLTAGATTPVVPLHLSQRGMSFAAVESPQGSWIVGVGGEGQGHTIIYDVAASKEFHGPDLSTNKMDPVLIPFRGQLYVLSRRPSVKWGASGLDYLPWFERICFKDGRPRWSCLSEDLEPPPIFPCRINPIEYSNPPEICVAAYATVGSHILLSVQQENADKVKRKYKGTCGYDVDRDLWEMVHDMNLPFLGKAVPLRDQLFLARSKVRDGAAVVYSMEVGQSISGKSELSIREVKVVAPKGRIVLGELLFPLERDRFSTVLVRSADPGSESKLDKVCVVHRNYDLVRYNAEGYVIIAKQQGQVYKLDDGSCPLVHPFPVVAAFTMKAE